MNTTTCTRCKGKGRLKGVSYAGGVCAKCGGTGTVEVRSPEAVKAGRFISWATEEGCKREKGTRQAFAAHAARHLQATAPDRFAKAIASWEAGRADDVYAALIAFADEASRR